MKRVRRISQKLNVTRETLRLLSTKQLAAVAGGRTGDECPETDQGSCKCKSDPGPGGC
jgi:hypothetical protein